MSGTPRSVAFSPNGALVATADYSAGVSVFSVNSAGALTGVPGTPFGTAPGSQAVAFSPSGGFLATADGSGFVSVFQVQPDGALIGVPGTPFATGSSPNPNPASVAFSPSGRLLAAANSSENSVTVFAVAADGSLSQVGTFGTTPNPVSVAFNPSGDLLATADDADGVVSVFTVGADGTLSAVQGSPFGAGANPSSVAFSPSGGLLAVADYNSNADSTSYLTLFQVGSSPYGALTQVASVPPSFTSAGGPEFGASSVAFSANGNLLAVANYGYPYHQPQNVSLFVLGVAGSSVTPLPPSPLGAGAAPYAIAFSPSTPFLATANLQGYQPDTISVFAVHPTAGISQPTAFSNIHFGDLVNTSFYCNSDGVAPITSCDDNHGTTTQVGGSGTLNTLTTPPCLYSSNPCHYTVNGTSIDGTATVDAPFTLSWDQPPQLRLSPWRWVGRHRVVVSAQYQIRPISPARAWVQFIAGRRRLCRGRTNASGVARCGFALTPARAAELMAHGYGARLVGASAPAGLGSVRGPGGANAKLRITQGAPALGRCRAHAGTATNGCGPTRVIVSGTLARGATGWLTITLRGNGPRGRRRQPSTIILARSRWRAQLLPRPGTPWWAVRVRYSGDSSHDAALADRRH